MKKYGLSYLHFVADQSCSIFTRAIPTAKRKPTNQDATKIATA